MGGKQAAYLTCFRPVKDPVSNKNVEGPPGMTDTGGGGP